MALKAKVDAQAISASVQQWLEEVVIGLNLCPFAKRELAKKRIRFTVLEASTEELLLEALNSELELIFSDDAIETALLILPNVLQDFHDYNQFLDLADSLLVSTDFEGEFQIASFHPDYQFDVTGPGDSENYTNRAPYPVLHILREASIERALADYPDANKISERNISLLESMGIEKIQQLFDRHKPHTKLNKTGV